MLLDFTGLPSRVVVSSIRGLLLVEAAKSSASALDGTEHAIDAVGIVMVVVWMMGWWGCTVGEKSHLSCIATTAGSCCWGA